jgi:hypothetical protein
MFDYSMNTYANSQVKMNAQVRLCSLGVLVFHGMTHICHLLIGVWCQVSGI